MLRRLCIALLFAAFPAQAATLLAKPYEPGIQVEEYWVSEKLDGVRARWDGQHLWSRGGHRFAAPDWFVAGFPNKILDGELWSARGDYQNIASITARQQPHDGWAELKLMVFDLPEHGGKFSQRVVAMRQLKAVPYLQAIEQSKMTEDELFVRLEQVIAAGGEGLMLHHQYALYKDGRSDQLLKLKPFQEADALVIGYSPGKGRYQGLLGALQVRLANGIEFKIGSGLSDAQRRNPPLIGSTVSFKHQGFTDSGKPRFAVFLRQRSAP